MTPPAPSTNPAPGGSAGANPHGGRDDLAADIMFSSSSSKTPAPVPDPRTMIDEHAAVRAAGAVHAKASRRITDAVARADALEKRIGEIDAERAALADAIVDGTRDAVTRDGALAAESTAAAAEVAAVRRALPTAEVVVAEAAKSYRAARETAAREVAAALWRDADESLPETTRLRDAASAAEGRIGQLRTASQLAAALGREIASPRLQGAPHQVRELLLYPPAGVAWPTSRLLEALEPFVALTKFGDVVEVDLVHVGTRAEKLETTWRRVAVAELPAGVAEALGKAVCAERSKQSNLIDSRSKTQRESAERNAVIQADRERQLAGRR